MQARKTVPHSTNRGTGWWPGHRPATLRERSDCGLFDKLVLDIEVGHEWLSRWVECLEVAQEVCNLVKYFWCAFSCGAARKCINSKFVDRRAPDIQHGYSVNYVLMRTRIEGAVYEQLSQVGASQIAVNHFGLVETRPG